MPAVRDAGRSSAPAPSPRRRQGSAPRTTVRVWSRGENATEPQGSNSPSPFAPRLTGVAAAAVRVPSAGARPVRRGQHLAGLHQHVDGERPANPAGSGYRAGDTWRTPQGLERWE